MNENLEQTLEELFRRILYKVYNIKEIFEFFYGESFVDLQGLDFEKFKRENINRKLLFILTSRVFEKYPELDKNSELSSLDLEDYSFLLEDDVILKNIDRVEENYNILVHLPEVRITNEHDRFVDAKDFYVKVKIDRKGRIVGTFTVNRATYTSAEYFSDYMHSHLPGINKQRPREFKSPCLGSGPISNTITSLAYAYDEDLWNLFCFELSSYMKTESIGGGPYRRLEQITSSSRHTTEEESIFVNVTIDNTTKDILKFYIPYLIQSKILIFSYRHNNYTIGMNFLDLVLAISNNFIDYYNREFDAGTHLVTYNRLLETGILKSCIVKDGKIVYDSNITNISSLHPEQNNVICRFKGNDVVRTITLPETTGQNITTILNPSIISHIIIQILKILNFRSNDTTTITSRDGETTDEIRKKYKII